MRAAKKQARLRNSASSPETSLLAHKKGRDALKTQVVSFIFDSTLYLPRGVVRVMIVHFVPESPHTLILHVIYNV